MSADQPTLRNALVHASSRYTLRPMVWRGRLIYAAVFGLWGLVLLGAWRFTGILAWSAGLAYVTYDTWLLFYVASKTWYLLGQPAAQPPHQRDPAAPSLGVLVVARNEEAALPRTLDALLAQIDPPDEILLVDDGSSDHTALLLADQYEVRTQQGGLLGRSTRHAALSVLRRSPAGKAEALNRGLAELRTDIVVTVDADTILVPTAIAGMRGAFHREPALVAACGVLTPICAPGPAGSFFQWFQTYEYIRAFLSRIAWMRSDSLLLVSGAFAGFRRDALVRVGGFDADCLVEDYELVHRLHRFAREHEVDWRVRVIPEARATTDAPATLVTFLRQRRRWFAGFLQTQYWNRDMTGNPRYGALGRRMLPIKAIDTMQPIYGLTAFVLLVWFLVTGNSLLALVLSVVGLKIAIDLAFHLWSVRLYTHWIGERTTGARLGLAALAALAEPFSFQLLRHAGAAWGWFSFVTGRYRWGTR